MPSNKTIVFGAVLCLLMIGCRSFNTYQFPSPIVVMVKPENNESTVQAPPVVIPGECLYRMPKLEAIPEVPIDELEKINENDDAALDRIQQDYMKQLRTFIRKRQAVHREAYQEYLKRCTPLVNPHDGKNTGP